MGYEKDNTICHIQKERKNNSHTNCFLTERSEMTLIFIKY